MSYTADAVIVGGSGKPVCISAHRRNGMAPERGCIGFPTLSRKKIVRIQGCQTFYFFQNFPPKEISRINRNPALAHQKTFLPEVELDRGEKVRALSPLGFCPSSSSLSLPSPTKISFIYELHPTQIGIIFIEPNVTRTLLTLGGPEYF